MRILVIEDDDMTCWVINRVLKNDGHHAKVIKDGGEGFKLAQSSKFDAIILDILLPTKDGIQIAKDLRRLRITTPILMLSSKSSEDDRVLGLDAGADDYLPKPYGYKELQARIRAITRRPSVIIQSQLSFGDLKLDPESREVTRQSAVIKLRPKEYQLLEYMMRNPNTALSKNVLLRKVWGIHSKSTSNRLEAHIKQLRAKIDRPYKSNYIQTVHNVGYMLSSK